MKTNLNEVKSFPVLCSWLSDFHHWAMIRFAIASQQSNKGATSCCLILLAWNWVEWRKSNLLNITEIVCGETKFLNQAILVPVILTAPSFNFLGYLKTLCLVQLETKLVTANLLKVKMHLLSTVLLFPVDNKTLE